MQLNELFTILKFDIMKNFLFLILILAVGLISCERKKEPKPVNQQQLVIVDTDIASSTDDLVLMHCLYGLSSREKIRLAAVMVSRNGEVNAKMADIMNTYYGHPDLPIGVTHSGPDSPTVWIDYWKMCEPQRFPDEPIFSRRLTDEEIAALPDAAKLYRKILSQSKDGEVVIFLVGFANNIARLLESEADEHSPLNGVELMRQKVKAIYLQAGHYGHANDPDYNFQCDPTSALTLMQKCPVPMYFSPLEAGDLFNYEPEEILLDLDSANMSGSPLYHCYSHHECDTSQRMWDVMTLLSWLYPDYFFENGPYAISLTDDMILIHNEPSGTSCHYFLLPDPSKQAAIMQRLRLLVTGATQGQFQ